MKICIVDRQPAQAAETRELAERRLLFALSRFGAKVERVSMMIADVNGPRGGVDKSCQVSITMRRLANIVVSSEEATVEAAIARAADRAQRAVSRAIDRSQQLHRQRYSVDQ